MIDVLVTYDVATDSSAGRRRLRRVATLCLAHGQRVQLSVFECRLNDGQLEAFEERLQQEIDPEEDSIRIYVLPGERNRRVRVYGKPLAYEINETLIL